MKPIIAGIPAAFDGRLRCERSLIDDTLHAWRVRFHQSLDRVRALGFDDRFIRMWDLYLAYCEAAFLERHVGLFQLLLVKNGSQRALFNDAWLPSAAGGTSLAEAARQTAA